MQVSLGVEALTHSCLRIRPILQSDELYLNAGFISRADDLFAPRETMPYCLFLN